MFDLLLGNHEQIFSCGQLAEGLANYPDDLCSCQQSGSDCEFWGDVYRRFEEKYPEQGIAEYRRMLQYLTVFYRLPQTVISWLLPRWVKEHYEPMTRDFFGLVADKSGCQYIVDSSKDFARAWYLLKTFPRQVKMIHLVRDGRGVLWSHLRFFRQGKPFMFLRRNYRGKRAWPIMAAESIGWSISNWIGTLMAALHSQMIVVRYEDLVRDPAGELQRIGKFLDLDMSALGKRIADGDELEIEHPIGGNRMRFSENRRFRFRPDINWPQNLPRTYVWLFTLLAFPLNWWYGYIGRKSTKV